MKMIPMQIRYVLAVLLAVIAFPVHAAQQAGEILFARGVVSIIGANDSARGARPGQPVFEGERIVTGRNSVVQVHLTDGTLVGLRGNSDYLIERQRYEPEQAGTDAEEESLYDQAGELFSGWMRMVTGAIGKSNPTSVRQSTSVATIGIRGTVYQVIHIPPDGLPGFPDTEPGTYLMLEEGEVEIAGEGGTRIVRPGDVVFVPYGGGKPRPAPDKRRLFETSDEEDDGSGEAGDEEAGDDFAEGEEQIDDQLNQTVDDRLTQEVGTPDRVLDANTFGMASVSPNSEGVTFGGASVADSELVLARDSDGNYYPLSAAVFDGNAGVTAQYSLGSVDEVPNELGTYQIRDASGALLGQAWWGYYDSSQYSLDDGIGGLSPGYGDWHWVIGSDVFADPEGLYANFLTGSLSYTLAGGTSLRGNLGSVYDITSGSALLVLDKREIGFDLAFNDGVGTVNLGGEGDLKTYFESGISIADGGGLWAGNIFGGLFTPELAGLLATMDLTNFSEDFQASLVFEQDGGALTPGTPPLANAGMVGGYRTGTPTESVVATGLYSVGTEDFGGAIAPTYSRHPSINESAFLATYVSSATATPVATGSATISGGASEVHWGVWDAADLEVKNLSTGAVTNPSSDMAYMVGSNAQSDTAAFNFLSAQGPTGSFTYAYVGGTDIIDTITGAVFATVENTSTIQFDFASDLLTVSLNVNEGFANTYQGSGTVADFYGTQSPAIPLNDFGGSSGAINGQFVGANMEGVISTISISPCVGNLSIGTAAFKR